MPKESKTPKHRAVAPVARPGNRTPPDEATAVKPAEKPPAEAHPAKARPAVMPSR